MEAEVQKSIYYESKSLQEVEIRYLPLEKAILAIVHSMRKLPHYFQAHTVVVFTQLLLQSLLQRSDYIGRIAKWGTILGAFDIEYLPYTTIKGQVLVDLIAKFTECPERVTAEVNESLGYTGHSNYYPCTTSMEALCRWGGQPEGVRYWNSLGIPRKDYH